MSEGQLGLEWIPGTFAVCRLGADEAVPGWAVDDGPPEASGASGFLSITRTDRELSIVVGEDRVPTDVRAERGWVALRVSGTLDFGLVGILSRLAGALADAGVPLFAVSTYDTDILLVKAKDKGRAVEALRSVADCSSL